MDNITVDRETLKALGADTRIAILKQLNKRRMTQAELASELGMAAPSVKEHLERLEQAKLVEQKDEGRKWKYFELTSKGAGIVQPSNAKIWFLLAISFLAFAASTFQVYGQLFAAPVAQALPQLMRTAVESAPAIGASAGAASDASVQTAQIAPQAAASALHLPLPEIAIMLVALLLVGACIGILVKKE